MEVPTGLPMAQFNAAYRDGLRNGHLDRILNHRSDYAWFSINSPHDYTRIYAEGYRKGWLS